MDAREKTRIIEAHHPHWSSAWVWLGFLAAFTLGEAGILWAIVRGPIWLLVPLVPIVAHIMHAQLIALHEASHRTLCPSRRWNDCIGMLIGTLSFMSFTLYRTAHHSHHAYLSTERDEELWPFVIPDTRRWVRRLAVALELTLGVVYTPFLFLRSLLRQGSPIKARLIRRRIWGEFALMAVVWGSILAATSYWNAWPIFLVCYVVPAMLAGNMQSLRKYIEHMGLTSSTVLGSTRSVLSHGPIGRLVAFSLFNIPYHGVHHRYAGLPQSRMPEFTALLGPTREEEPAPYPNYRSAFGDMVRTLADPRVGSQWRSAWDEASAKASPVKERERRAA